jgi:hypothetical protein
MPVPPPPTPTAGAPIPPPPAPTATAAIPAPIPAAAPRPAATPANRSVGKFAATIDLLALAASLTAVVFLALELFVKSKG